MSTLLRAARAIACGPVFLCAAVFAPAAQAQTQAEFDARIAQFRVKLNTVEASQADARRRVDCLNQRDAQLTPQRRNLELTLGPLRAQEQTAAPDVERRRSEYEGFAATLRTEQGKLSSLRNELARLQREKQWQENWVRECEAEKDWKRLWGLTCAADMGIAKTFGAIKSYEGDIAAAAKNEQIARDSMEHAQTNLQASQKTLDETRTRLAQVNESIRQTEATLVSVSRMLSEVRALEQPFQLVIGDFSSTLEQAKEVNLEEKRRRTLILLANVDKDADAALKKMGSAIAQTEATLGANWLKQCTADH